MRDRVLELGFFHQRLGDLLLVPVEELVPGARIDQERDVGRAAVAAHGLPHTEHVPEPCPPFAVQDVGLGGLGVSRLDKGLLDEILDVLDARRVVVIVVVFDKDRDDFREVLGRLPVLAADRGGRLENGIGNLGVVEGSYPPVPLHDLLELCHRCYPSSYPSLGCVF